MFIERPILLGCDFDDGLDYGPIETNAKRDMVAIFVIDQNDIWFALVKLSCKGRICPLTVENAITKFHSLVMNAIM